MKIGGKIIKIFYFSYGAEKVSEWVREGGGYVMARTSYIRWDDDDVRFVLDERSTWTRYPESEQINTNVFALSP